jgi:hypothetical protein
MSMTENVAGSGLGLNHLKLIHKRSGEDGLRNIFCAKNSHGRPRITSDKKVLDNTQIMSVFLSLEILFSITVYMGMYFVQVL